MGLAASGNLRPWIGSAIVHGLAVAALALAAVQWRTDQPPPQLAIEGNGVEAGRMHIATMHLARAFAKTAVEAGKLGTGVAA